MKINIAVSGAFHYRNYVQYINEYGLLNKFYFSHSIGAGRRSGLQRGKYLNFSPKEYLTQGHGRLIGEAFSEVAYPLYARLWTLSVLAAWTRADILHALAHGFVAPLIERARREGTKVIAEAVNTHPANQMDILAREADRWGLPARPASALTRAQATIIEETRAADRLLVPTETVKRSFVARGVDPAKIIKIPYAANTTRFRPRDESDVYSPFGRALRVICVGSIGLRKGQFHLLEAARRLGKGTVEVTLVGTPTAEVAPVLAGYETEFRHIRIANDRLRDLLVQHDVFVLPSVEEGLARSICEAMACGLPIVATRESGAEELMTEGQEGFFVEAGSADAIAKCLACLDRHRDLLVALGARAAEATRRRINWRTYANRLIEAYKELDAA
jgi:glycosyltransferase involved in cell wall biosynthesis